MFAGNLFEKGSESVAIVNKLSGKVSRVLILAGTRMLRNLS